MHSQPLVGSVPSVEVSSPGVFSPAQLCYAWFSCSVVLWCRIGNTFILHIKAEEKTINKRKGGQQTYLDAYCSVPVNMSLVLIPFICSVRYLDFTLEALHIDHLFQSLLNLWLAPLLSLSFSHIILLSRTGFLSCFCRVLWWHPGDTMPSTCSDKDGAFISPSMNLRSVPCPVRPPQKCHITGIPDKSHLTLPPTEPAVSQQCVVNAGNRVRPTLSRPCGVHRTAMSEGQPAMATHMFLSVWKILSLF